ncbi:hypothetical protein [Pseudomonas sp. B1-22]|uniref:hypothetical protein n=1 Tax=Pseudomonas sp. B1-22 TaxID=3141456 RepID=UPI003D283277
MEQPIAFGEITSWREVEEATVEIFGDMRSARAWLGAPMIRFAGLSPAKAWEQGQHELVIEIVRQAAAGFVF